MEHVCVACKRRRSASYHEQHPLNPGRRPKPGVCSRCIRKLFLSEPEELSSMIVKEVHHHHYYEVHHYHYPVNKIEEATSPHDLPAFCAELSSDAHYRHQVWSNDDPPPPVYPGTKPTLSRETGRRRDEGRDIAYRNGTVPSDADSLELRGLW